VGVATATAPLALAGTTLSLNIDSTLRVNAGNLGIANSVVLPGAPSAASLSLSGSLTLSGNIVVGSNNFLQHDTNYNYLAGPDGVTHLALGTSTIGLNTHYQIKHEFRDNSGTVQATIDNTVMNVPTNITTPYITTPLVRAGSSAYAAVTTAINVGYGGGSAFGVTCRPGVDSAFPVVFYNAAGTQVGTISTTSTTTAYNTTSDERLKMDFQPFDAGPALDAMQVYNFAWRSTGERAYGVVAQQAIQVFPEAVTHDSTLDMWAVDYSKFVPLLLQEIKALRARVAALEGS
jgi:hypothetical protein